MREGEVFKHKGGLEESHTKNQAKIKKIGERAGKVPTLVSSQQFSKFPFLLSLPKRSYVVLFSFFREGEG